MNGQENGFVTVVAKWECFSCFYIFNEYEYEKNYNNLETVNILHALC